MVTTTAPLSPHTLPAAQLAAITRLAKARFEGGKKWTQGAARNQQGQMCLLGGVQFAAEDKRDGDEVHDRHGYKDIERRIRSILHTHGVGWNDHYGRIYDEVDRLLDRVIESFEKEIKA